MPAGHLSYYGLPFPTVGDMRSWADSLDRSRLREELRMPLTCLLYWIQNGGHPRPVARPGVISRWDRIICRQLWAYYSLYHRLAMLADPRCLVVAGCYVCGTATTRSCPRCAAPHCRQCTRDHLACACVVLGPEHLRAHQIDAARHIFSIMSGPIYGQPTQPAAGSLSAAAVAAIDETEDSGGDSSSGRSVN